MRAKPLIHLVWIPGILGLALWFWPGNPSPTAVPELTRDEANRQAAPAIRKIRQTLSPAPAPPATGGPAIRLRAETILPAMDFGPIAHARPSPRGYPWMVLFNQPIQPAWQEELEAAGAVVRAYLPDHALLIEAPLAGLEKIRRLPQVAWSGEYRPAHKIQPLLAGLARQNPALSVPVTIQTFSPGDAAALARQLQAAGASDIRATAAKRWGLVRAVMPARTASDLAALPEVQWIEHHETPEFLNDFARASEHLDIDAAREEHGLSGDGQIVAIADTGLDTGNRNTLHPDFAGRLLEVLDTGRLTNWSDAYYHGTHVAASLLGTGAASGGQYRGAAPGAQLVFQSILTDSATLNLPDDLNEFYQPPYDLGARIHSDSWGSAVYGEYTSDSMTTDEFVWDHPDMLPVFAAGNEGIDADRNGVVDAPSLDSPASAKNVLAVGASESGRPSGSGGKTAQTYGSAWPWDYPAPPISTDLISSSPDDGPQGMAAYSSRGPAADGRTKPDLVAPGTDIISARSRASAVTGWGVLGGNTNYCFMGGTSMATPLAAGGATLVRQYCTDVLGMPQPSAALLKAALLGGARSLAPGQYGTDGFREVPAPPRPNSTEGWGQADIAGTLFPLAGAQAVLMEGPSALNTGGTDSFAFSVVSNTPLTIVLAYSDYPSALSAAVNLVNDLDLLLLDPDGVPHRPNGLGEADRLNNIEGLDVAAPKTGRWTLSVSAPNVPQGPQPYALYLRGAIQMPATIEHTPLDNTWITNQAFRIAAEVTSPGELDAGTIQLHWLTIPGSGAFATTAMLSTNGSHFEASIPAQPVGTRVYYYLSAGPSNLTTFHPADAPVELHRFEIRPPVTLAVSGWPSNFFTADPAYGVHTLASNTAVHASASYPPDGTNGWRTACVGWQGTGSIAATGTADFCDFTLTGDSSIAWLWQEQVALMHTSSPHGAIAATIWHARDAIASSLAAPEGHMFNNVPLTFAGWTVDGARWPDNHAPSRRQIDGIPMPGPRLATATYVDTALDSDANGLPDWFELRYFGSLGQDRYADPDGDGYENELEAADHSDPLNAASLPVPPAIQHHPLPSPASNPAPWTVAATITDNYLVASATLHWQRNGGLARSIAMTPSADHLFTAAIPSPARDGDRIDYFLSAADDAGFSSQSPTWTVTVAYARIAYSPTALEASATAGMPTNIMLQIQNIGSRPLEISMETAPIGFADDMESGTNGWTRPDGNVDWHISAQNSHSTSNAWYCGQEASRTYRDSTHAALATPPIHLAATASRLDFMHRARFEIDQDEFPDGIHYWDSGVLEISDSGGLTWQSLVPEGGYPGLITSNPASPFAPDTPCFVDTADWDPAGADLSAYANREVQIRFRFGADRYVVAEGWRIDDFVVSPRTEYGGWLALPANPFSLGAGLASNLVLTLDPARLPPMASDHLAILIHHNDPEQASPIVVPIVLHNTSRRVRVTTEGDGQATPSGDILVAPDQSFTVDFDANAGAFIFEIQTNSVLLPFTDVTNSKTLHWSSIQSNLDIHAVFAPWLDADPIPSEWLAAYGLTNRSWMAEAMLDPDTDGFTTLDEYTADTDPVDEASYLRVSRLSPALTNCHEVVWTNEAPYEIGTATVCDVVGMIITWPCSTGRVYDLQSRSNLLTGAWLPMAGWTNLVPHANEISITNLWALPWDPFVRVRVRLP